MNASAAFQHGYDGAEEAEVQWPAPDMTVLGGGRAVAVPFPGEMFGGVWPLVKDLAEGAGSPVDYVGASLLAVAASLVGGKRRIRPFATAPDWIEPCILWVGNVGDPSTNKTPGQNAITNPLNPMEHRHARSFEEVIRSYETKFARAKAECKAWETQVTEAQKEGHETPPKPAKASEPEKPQRKRLIVRDTTPEAAAEILSGNPHGILVVRDELAGWLTSFERYAPGGREFWLEAFGGNPHTIDRKSVSKPVLIPFCGVSVLGGVQPEKLQDCVLSGSDDGLVARFIWAWPDPIPYRRPRAVADTSRLERILERLDGLSGEVDPYTETEASIVIPLSSAGADLFEAWVADQSEAVANAASFFKGFCGKLRGIVLRLALASELIAWADGDGPEPSEVSAKTLVAVLSFVEEYAKPMALRVFGDAARPQFERDASEIARHLIKEKVTLLNPRDHRDRCAPLKDTERRDRAIAHLIEADWLRPAPGRAGATPGRARNDYAVNPLAVPRGEA